MSPQLIMVLLVAGLGACFGWLPTHHYYANKIDALNASILVQRGLAEQQLKDLAAQLITADGEANKLNTDLEQAHGFAIKTINDFYDTHANARLYDSGASRPSSGCPVSKADHPKVTTKQAESTELSKESSQFLFSETKRADELAAYAAECHAFVANNCGIK